MRTTRSRSTSVRLRLTLWSVGMLALVLLVMGVIFRGVVQTRLLHSVDMDLYGWAQHSADRWQTGRVPGRTLDAAAPAKSGQPPLLRPRPHLLNAPGQSALYQTSDT